MKLPKLYVRMARSTHLARQRGGGTACPPPSTRTGRACQAHCPFWREDLPPAAAASRDLGCQQGHPGAAVAVPHPPVQEELWPRLLGPQGSMGACTQCQAVPGRKTLRISRRVPVHRAMAFAGNALSV